MLDQDLHAALDAALSNRRLLTHPFYQRWCRGELSADDLRGYAEQYRFFEAEVPAALARVRDGIADSEARAMVQRNLDDETGVTGTAHLELFERFASSLGARPGAPPSAATAGLTTTYRALAGAGPAAGLAAMLAYESQAAEIAESKASGLVAHHGMSGEALEFWNVHATADVEHAQWALDALAALGATPDEVRVSARAAADAWWAFLDERDADHAGRAAAVPG